MNNIFILITAILAGIIVGALYKRLKKAKK